MRELDKISENLFEKIRGKFEDVSLGDENAKSTDNPAEARFFNFDYLVDGHNHGNITISLIDELSLKIYFSKNISNELDEQEQKRWYAFLRDLRNFAKRNMLTFEPRDITRATLKIRDIKHLSKDDSTFNKAEVDQLGESRMYGTLHRSYESFGPVRIKLVHSKPIMDDAYGARSRNIQAIYVENEQLERFKLPFNNLTGARAMARHISAGGIPSDDFGQHITNLVNEMNSLRPFVHQMRHRTFEDVTTQGMVESAFDYHRLLKSTLTKMKGKKGYSEYKENYKPMVAEDDVNVDELKEKFVKKVYDDRISAALPVVYKAYNLMKEQALPETAQFESWVTRLSEGTWVVPETAEEIDQLEELLKNPLEVGIDAENATGALAELIGNDDLYDDLVKLAEVDPRADARDLIKQWLDENMPEISDKLINQGVTEDDMKEERAIPADSTASPMTHTHAADTYCDACDRLEKDCVCETDEDDYEYDEDQVEMITRRIVSRIVNDLSFHTELIKKAGPDGILNAAQDVASFHAPVQELGSSDVGNMIRQVYQEVGVEYPEENVREGLKDWTAGALAAGAIAGAGQAYLGQQDIERDPYVQQLEQQYQQVMTASDQAYAQGDITKVKQLQAKKDSLEDQIENAKAAAEMGVDSEESARVNAMKESLDDFLKLAGL